MNEKLENEAVGELVAGLKTPGDVAVFLDGEAGRAEAMPWGSLDRGAVLANAVEVARRALVLIEGKRHGHD